MRGTFSLFACIGVLLVSLPCSSAVVGQIAPELPTRQDRSENRTLRFDHLSVSDGLSQKVVSAILQDRTGFLWFGTQSGLNRYDGYDVRVYKYDPDDPGSLSHNWVMGLLEDRSGVLWVGTFGGGLNRFDAATETFTRFKHDPDDPHSLSHDFVGPLYEDRQGLLWIGTEGGGLNRFDPAAETFSRFHHDRGDPTSLSDSTNAVRAIYEDGQGQLWIGTWGGGLCRFNRDTQTFTHFHLDSDGAPETVLGFYEDRQGVLWAATEHAGLNRVDRSSDTVAPIALVDGDILADTPIGTIYEDRRGSVWLGTWGQGLCRFDPATRAVSCYRHDPFDPHSLRDDGVGAIYEDRSGVLWVSTWGGLSRLDLRATDINRFRHDPHDPYSLSDRDVRTVYVDRTGTLWAGTWNGGLNRLDAGSGRFQHYRYSAGDPNSLGNDNVQAILEDRNGAIWIGTWGGGLNRFDPASNVFTRFVHDPADSGSLHSNSVLVIYEDREGMLWIGTWDGLSRLDPDTGTFERIPDQAQAIGGPGHVEVWSIHEDRDGVLWIGTRNNGLGRLDRNRDTLTFSMHDPGDVHSLGHNTVWDIHEDRHGKLWVATGGGGLNSYDRRTGRFTRFTTRQSDLPDNVIYSIIEDRNRHLWLGTEKGLSRFEPTTANFTNYNERPDLRSCGYNSAAFYESGNGTMYVGCSDGVVTFQAEQIGENTSPPSVVLTDLKLFGRSVQASSKGPLKEPLSEAREVVFNHNENDLTFTFVALHFVNPAYNQYAYQLEDYDEDWHQAGTQRTATYTNLDPGAYVFRVRAANSDGVWNETGAGIRVVIRPPWWSTPPAYLLYGLLFLASVAAVNRFQRRRFIRKEREAALITENELRAEAAEARAHALHLENQRQTQELEHARRVQLSMLPRMVPEHSHAVLAAAMQTAAEVGGDYYDFSVAPNGSLTFIIGDATGHGVQAGTMVTAMKSLWNAFSAEPDLKRLLTKSNQALRKMRLPKIYMAVAVGRLEGHTLELVGAGMPAALVYRAATGSIENVPLKGMPLATPFAFPYRRRVIALSPGDVVVLMSDGFPELFDGSGEMLGYDRAADLIAGAVPDRTPESIIAHLMGKTAAWRGSQPPNDDVTFIVLKASAVTEQHVTGGDGTSASATVEIL